MTLQFRLLSPLFQDNRFLQLFFAKLLEAVEPKKLPTAAKGGRRGGGVTKTERMIKLGNVSQTLHRAADIDDTEEQSLGLKP